MGCGRKSCKGSKNHKNWVKGINDKASDTRSDILHVYKSQKALFK